MFILIYLIKLMFKKKNNCYCLIIRFCFFTKTNKLYFLSQNHKILYISILAVIIFIIFVIIPYCCYFYFFYINLATIINTSFF